jgi:hypothetical protein
VLLALGALLAVPGPAEATEVISRGSVVVRWHSNPATCAERGLCGRSGTLSWRPDPGPGGINLSSYDFGFLSIFSTNAVARSYRGSMSCIDRVGSAADIVAEPGPRPGVLVFSMRDVTDFNFGRCAGPLAADFAAALPQAPPVTTKALRRGALVDFRAERTFSAGPFEGEVSSTLALRTRPEKASADDGSSHSVTQRPSRGRLVRYGIVSARYAVESLAGDAGYALSGAAWPECEPFDACGMTGDLMVHADVREGSVVIVSTRRIPANATETVAAGLRAFRRGGTSFFGDGHLGRELDFDTEPEPGAPFAIPFSETVTPGGGETCSDTGSFREPYLDVDRRRTAIALRLLHGGNSLPDPLRTRCPGPGSDEVGALATGFVRLESVGQPRIELPLAPALAFTTVGMRGDGRGELKLSLRLTSLRAVTRMTRVRRETL